MPTGQMQFVNVRRTPSGRGALPAWSGRRATIWRHDRRRRTLEAGRCRSSVTSTNAKPVFASDLSGAEWTVAAEVRAGAVVLVLTAPDQSAAGDTVASVTITNPGNGYTADPTVTFSAPPSGGTATGTATRSGSVDSVTITTAGSGYTSVPTVTFGVAPSGGTTATGAAAAPRPPAPRCCESA